MLTCFLVVAAYYVGRISAHIEVARECDRLGGFYVGSTVYQCTAKLNVKSQESETELKVKHEE